MGEKENLTPACISKNTLDLRVYLEKLGYRASSTYDSREKILWTSGWRYYSTDYVTPEEVRVGETVLPYGVWCGGNEKLFKAVVALRERTDSFQWFTDDLGVWEMSESVLPSRYMQMCGHKATLQELINNFNG